jgi:hypothetical protein
MSNDVIIEVKIKDQQGAEHSKYVTGNLLLIYKDEIVIFADTDDLVGTKYPLSKMESMGVVGRYDKDGKECKHYAERVKEIFEKEGV